MPVLGELCLDTSSNEKMGRLGYFSVEKMTENARDSVRRIKWTLVLAHRRSVVTYWWDRRPGREQYPLMQNLNLYSSPFQRVQRVCSTTGQDKHQELLLVQGVTQILKSKMYLLAVVYD